MLGAGALGLGLGPSILVFSIVESVLLKPLPFVNLSYEL
jgi:hypothetical protein